LTFCIRPFNPIPQHHAFISPFKLTANPWTSFKFHEQHCEVCDKKNRCTARFEMYSDTLCPAFHSNKEICSFIPVSLQHSVLQGTLKIGCCSSRLTMAAITNCKCVKRASQHLYDRLLARGPSRASNFTAGRSKAAESRFVITIHILRTWANQGTQKNLKI
jgi:hypothetical protein